MDLIGHAAIHQGGESLFADKITFERDTKIVHASGNAVMVGKSSLVQGSEMHFNLETRTGTILDGRVSTDQFTLSGERINKLGVDRYQAHRADYSTCKDCPQSWTLSAADVDLQVDGYAYLSNVTAKVADAPGFWIPYLIVPIKTKRQSGLLMPQFGFTNEGFTFVQPFFWAISRSIDMTIGAGNFGGRGRRFEWEGRYALSQGRGTANFYHLNDKTFPDYLKKYQHPSSAGDYSTERWGLKLEQTQELPFGIHEKLRIVDVSDSLYINQLGDLPGNGEAHLVSDLSFSHAGDTVSSYVTAKRYRNLLTPLTGDPRAFDKETVQVLPEVEVSTNDKVFFNGDLGAGLSLGVTNFAREGGFFDRDPSGGAVPAGNPFRPGIDPIREAARARVNQSLYTSFRVADVVSVVPRANYRHYFYDFGGHASGLSRGYLNLELDLSTQFERVYDRDPTSEFPRVKHLIRPLISYSVIPFRHEPAHPFIQQMDHARDGLFTGYNFDNEDVVPMDNTLNNANYFAPKGNAVSYGFTTQIARKRKVATAEGAPVSYAFDQPVEWSAGQSFNLRELRKDPDKQMPLSRFYSLMTANFDRVNGYGDFYYIPYQPISEDTSRFVYSLGANWIISKGVGRVLAFERNLGATYSFNRSNNQSPTKVATFSAVYSLNDYIMPGASLSYDLLRSRWTEANTTLTFQSPSECWKLDLKYLQKGCPKLNPEDSGWCGSFLFNLSLNLTGSGFGSISDPKSIAAAPAR